MVIDSSLVFNQIKLKNLLVDVTETTIKEHFEHSNVTLFQNSKIIISTGEPIFVIPLSSYACNKQSRLTFNATW